RASEKNDHQRTARRRIRATDVPSLVLIEPKIQGDLCVPGEARERPLQETGGGSGIRTHVTVSRKHAFQACAFSHSATPPHRPASGPHLSISNAQRATSRPLTYPPG